MNVGERLREERERMGLSQEAMGAIGGVKKLAQFNYEKGERAPDSTYLAAIAAAGADVLYVLTGQRSGDAPAVPASPRVRALVENYEAADEAGRRVIEGAADLAAKSARPMKRAG
ncbi:helix-turn-helix domain-containing protein [Thauera butanivorans]|uniref:helix-turn-helix domain-containing protein n=1 Tax=Thauera butanivorans TaxID=86174 RepID=UPI003AB2B13E